MRFYTLPLAVALVATAIVNVGADETYSIPEDKREPGAIYWGDPSAFTNPACVDYTALIESTPEYKDMKKRKLSSSDPASWILMSDAADRVSSAIAYVAKDKEYDLICAAEYWEELNLGVSAQDITKLVKETIEKKD